ncbi:ribonuclease HII [Candidatus Dependentiae bacterium]|nr:ribonuclease HII [Candidatus Dependentiae bacterium]
MKKSSKQRSNAISKDKKLYPVEKHYWKENKIVCGIDEAGRGCMAGPVVIAAAILKPNTKHKFLIDSKKLTDKQLIFMYNWLLDKCIFSVSIASPRLIDQYNIYQTTARHMRLALLHVLNNSTRPNLIAVDAMPINLQNTPYHDIEIVSMTQGESKSTSIAAASIIAKVTRDKLMLRLETSFPGYDLNKHKGYCTSLHKKNTLSLKPSIIHRNSYLEWILLGNNNEQQSIFC